MKINFTENQLELLKKIDFDFNLTDDLTDEQILEIDDKITDYFALKGLESDTVNDIGVICESIIDLLSEL